MDTNNKTSKSFVSNLNKISQPFYALPSSCQKTSAEIINEARAAIRESTQMSENAYSVTSVKPIYTQRPFTPRDKARIFFGKKAKNSRPPSAFSLKCLQFETSEQTSSTDQKYSNQPNSVELNNDKIFNLNVKDVLIHKIKLPSLDGPKRNKSIESTSLENLPEESETSGNIDNGDLARNAFSSPKERTDFESRNNIRSETPFGYPSKKQQRNSEPLILGAHHLNKIFENKQIVQDSESLFVKNQWFTNKEATKETKTENIDLTVDEIVAQLNEHGVNESESITLMSDLFDTLEKRVLFGTKLNSKLKIKVLKCLYKFVESQNEELLLVVAKIILLLRVTGNNLSGVCKLIFKVSRNDKNDHLFFNGSILELFVDSLGRSSPLDDAEACVYGYGAIKFLTMNPKLVEKILNLGILQLMVLHIKIVNAARIEKAVIPEQTNHALYQLTGALRNLASEEKIYEDFINCGVILELCCTMEMFHSDIDIISNIVRTLSIVSTHDSCCSIISNYNHINKIFVKIIDKYPGKEKIIVRLGYMMGNLLAKSDEARVNYYNEKNSIECLLNILNIYLQKYLNCGMKKCDQISDDASADVIVKMVRIIANSAINPEIGKTMIHSHGINLIEIFLLVLFTKIVKDNEELVLSVLSTLNNLSYYYDASNENDGFYIKQIDLSKALCMYIDCENNDFVTESIRVLGNLSRSKITRDYIIESSSFQTLVDILDRDNPELLRTTMGVFVNLMADVKNRAIFKHYDGIYKLINVLQTYGYTDWPLSMLVCQVIWNYCIDNTNLYDVFDASEIEQLLNILVDFLDEEKLFGLADSKENMDALSSQEYQIWDDFAHVGTNLLEKIEFFLDHVDPIQIISCSDDEDLCVPQKNEISAIINANRW